MKKTTLLILLFIAVWQLPGSLSYKVYAQTETPTLAPPSPTITPTISITETPNPTATITPSTTPATDNTPTSIPKSPTPTQVKKVIIIKPTITDAPTPTVTLEPTITPTPTVIGFMEKVSGRSLTYFFILSGLLLLGISFVLYRKRGLF